MYFCLDCGMPLVTSKTISSTSEQVEQFRVCHCGAAYYAPLIRIRKAKPGTERRNVCKRLVNQQTGE